MEERMSTDTTSDLIQRLKRIEGQMRGLQRMIEEQQDCADVIHQVTAARRALDKVGFIILTHRLQECSKRKGKSADSEAAMKEALDLFMELA